MIAGVIPINLVAEVTRARRYTSEKPRLAKRGLELSTGGRGSGRTLYRSAHEIRKALVRRSWVLLDAASELPRVFPVIPLLDGGGRRATIVYIVRASLTFVCENWISRRRSEWLKHCK